MVGKRRRMMLTNGGSILPPEYQRVEYLQGNGRAYIDLGINNKSTFGIRAKVVLNTLQGGNCYGAANNSNRGVGLRVRYNEIDYSAYPGANIVVPSDLRNKIVYVQSNYLGSGAGYVEGRENDTTISPLPSVCYGDSYFHFTLFGYMGSGGGVTNIGSDPLYHFQLTDGQDLIMNLWPCYRKSDNKPGFYDIIGDTFFTNAATSGDDFTVGPNI